MTVRKRLFINSLLLVVIPAITMMLLVILYFAILKTALFPDGLKSSNMPKSIQAVNMILNEFDRENLGNDTTLCKELTNRLNKAGYQVEITLDNRVLSNTLSDDFSEFEDISNAVKNSKLSPAIWIEKDGHEFYLETRTISNGELGIVIINSTRNGLFHFLDTDSMTKLLISMVIFLSLSVIVVVSFSMLLSKKLGKRITKPLGILLEGAKRIQAGNYNESIPELQDFELAQLADTMNQMKENLKLSKELNEQYEQYRREMLAGISHDLRTPLTSIRSYVQGLKDGVAVTPEKHTHYLDVIAKKANDMEGLIQSLFLVSKMETGAYTYNLEVVEMTQFLATTLDSISSDFNENQLEIQYFYRHGQEICANIDLTEFPRAIRNILHNSVKYNQEKRILETVTLEVNKSDIILSIKDNGRGVDNQELAFLFNTFYRSDPSRSNPAEGHGLGLAIVKHIIEGHGGTVSARNDNGLLIVIRIPAMRSEKIHEDINCRR